MGLHFPQWIKVLVDFQITSFYQYYKTLLSYGSYFPSVILLISYYQTSEWSYTIIPRRVRPFRFLFSVPYTVFF